MSDIQTQMRAAGIEPPNRIEADGKIHRFANKGTKKKDCWYWATEADGQVVGAAGDWKSGTKIVFGGKTQFRAVMDELKKTREDSAFEAARKAAGLWAISVSHGGSEYLLRKGVGAHGVRFNGDKVLVPMRDAKGTLVGLQTISPDGSKLFTKGCAKRGAFHVLGDLARPGLPILVGEGYATMATMHELTACPAVVVFDVGNLEPVIEALGTVAPKRRLILIADNDKESVCPRHKQEGGYHSPFKPRPRWCRCNPGLTEAKRLAEKYGVRWIAPSNSIKGTDWNDYLLERGPEVVYDAFMRGAAL